jgi:hypothetical protein
MEESNFKKVNKKILKNFKFSLSINNIEIIDLVTIIMELKLLELKIIIIFISP